MRTKKRKEQQKKGREKKGVRPRDRGNPRGKKLAPTVIIAAINYSELIAARSEKYLTSLRNCRLASAARRLSLRPNEEITGKRLVPGRAIRQR
jgi:hypothetical protein